MDFFWNVISAPSQIEKCPIIDVEWCAARMVAGLPALKKHYAFSGLWCFPLAVSDPGVRANYLCPALLSVFSVH